MKGGPDTEANDLHQAGEGQIVLVATPIGNLQDATDRLRTVLASAEIIAAEDTRTTQRLATALGVEIRGQLISHHDHNEQRSTPELLEKVRQGATVAVVTDAGMPVVSDPGFRLVQAAVQDGLTVTCAPGASAVTTALAVSGLPSDRFSFEGFVPKKHGEKTRFLTDLQDQPRTLIFFESPHRVVDTLQVMTEVFGEDQIGCVARELTKRHEEVVTASLRELLGWTQTATLRGEFVLLLAPADNRRVELDDEQQLRLVDELVATGMRAKDATKQIAHGYGGSARTLYNLYQQRR
ncbi:16S rRNA (cytidine(1402)-2'-O)-methyltransferase [Auritidibacter ignavus]|uniref:16S rRNA (cytidine(1402)-2'-O)-methyltransferase n=1 Tax=Auritidibacter ignavus TaxID=678932 RepID=UPI002FE636E6